MDTTNKDTEHETAHNHAKRNESGWMKLLRIGRAGIFSAFLCIEIFWLVQSVVMGMAVGDPDGPMFLASLYLIFAFLFLFPLIIALYYSGGNIRRILRALSSVLFVLIAVELVLVWWPLPDLHQAIEVSTWTEELQAKEPAVISGEWELEWEDAQQDYQEIITITFNQNHHHLTGHAVDPAEIPAQVLGSVVANQVRFIIMPERGTAPYQVVPDSLFVGEVTEMRSMQGTWVVNQKRGIISQRPKGRWSAKQRNHAASTRCIGFKRRWLRFQERQEGSGNDPARRAVARRAVVPIGELNLFVL
ncbi:MAG: DUF1275 domain-containing protein [bacterium]|nr:DUF1275 domain-containing protein [bacterium]